MRRRVPLEGVGKVLRSTSVPGDIIPLSQASEDTVEPIPNLFGLTTRDAPGWLLMGVRNLRYIMPHDSPPIYFISAPTLVES